MDSTGVLQPQSCATTIESDAYNLTGFLLYLKYDPTYHRGIGMSNGINVTLGRLLVDFRFDFEAKHLSQTFRGVG